MVDSSFQSVTPKYHSYFRTNICLLPPLIRKYHLPSTANMILLSPQTVVRSVLLLIYVVVSLPSCLIHKLNLYMWCWWLCSWLIFGHLVFCF